jgi:hypothetical protein
MNTSEPKKTIHEKMLESIKAGEVTMRPKWHFVLRGILLGFGAVLILFTLLYIISFIIFVLHQNGTWFAPAFGFRGLGILLFSLPWILILLAGIFIVVLEILVRRYSVAYRRPLLYSALGVIGIVLIGGFIIAQTSLHPRFFMNAREGRLPVAGGLYRGFGMQRISDAHPGIIVELNEEGFTMADPREDILTVIITPETQFPLGTNFTVHDRVLVIGKRASSTVTASGIRKIDDSFDMPPRPPRESTSSPRVFIKIRQ